MKLSDYVFQFLSKKEVTNIFMVSGGGIMHLSDSLRKTKEINYHCNYHEQACVIAAESYSRMSNRLGVCLVTTGPGSTNALSAVAGAWVDSIPLLVISGQVRTQVLADYSKLRSMAPQEINIDAMAKPVTKYFVTVKDPYSIQEHLEKALIAATTGRPGPVWINIPLDVQAYELEADLLKSRNIQITPENISIQNLSRDITLLANMIEKSRAPLIIAGNGIRLSNAVQTFNKFVQNIKTPVLTSVGSLDVIGEEDPYYVGRYGNLGQRRANALLNHSDLIIAIGASLSIASIGFNYDLFAPNAKKVMINIDPYESTKPVLPIDHAFDYDANLFLSAFNETTEETIFSDKEEWIGVIQHFSKKYPILEKKLQRHNGYINSYEFSYCLSELVDDKAKIITGISLDFWSIFHSFKVKYGQRIYTTINYGAMGWCLPGLIGACVGSGNESSILVTGDGSFQMNIQELLTIKYEKLPVTIFIFDNQGYQSIRSTQDSYFDSKYIGSDINTGILNPDYEKLASAYDISYSEINGDDNLKDGIRDALALKQPAICRVLISPEQERRPRLKPRTQIDGSRAAIDDMFPFRPLEEIEENRKMFYDEG
jgi:acetolactate synthase I/II/III large subunit